MALCFCLLYAVLPSSRSREYPYPVIGPRTAVKFSILCIIQHFSLLDGIVFVIKQHLSKGIIQCGLKLTVFIQITMDVTEQEDFRA